MVAAPYVLLTVFLVLVYRGFKKLQQADACRAVGQPTEPAALDAGGVPDPGAPALDAQ